MTTGDRAEPWQASGRASKQGLGSTLLIYWDPESSSSRRGLPPAFPFLEHGGVVLHVY